MAKIATSTNLDHPKTLLVGIYAPTNRMKNIHDYYDEFFSLVNTLGLKYDASHFIKLRSIDNNIFLTKGKLEELTLMCHEFGYQEILFSEILTPLQERNLEDVLGCRVFDRAQLILEIFKKSAQSSEGKIQVEMAEIEFFQSRIFGKGKQYAQQAGFIGGKGPGETISEELKRHFAEKLRQAKKRLDRLEKSRVTQRKQRIDRNIPLICIMGYTNSGKSSLLNRLTKSDVLAEDKLFATLDTTTREYFIAPTKKVLISDTVGFISQLPHKLIEAFKSTLEELLYATLLVHVIDISNNAWEDQIKVVNKTLEELGAQDKPIIHVFNKIDKLTPEQHEELQKAINSYENSISIHTLSKEGIAPLVEFIKNYSF